MVSHQKGLMRESRRSSVVQFPFQGDDSLVFDCGVHCTIGSSDFDILYIFNMLHVILVWP
jgi:hypothetical protein